MTAPEEEREPRGHVEVGERIHRAGRRARRVALDPQRELGAGEHALQRQLDAALEIATAPAFGIERHQAGDVVGRDLTAIGQPRQARHDAAGAGLFVGRRGGPAGEDAPAARRVARSRRVVGPGHGEDIEVRVARRVERVVRAAHERLQPPAVLRRRLLDERDADGVRPGGELHPRAQPPIHVVAGQRRVPKRRLEVVVAAEASPDAPARRPRRFRTGARTRARASPRGWCGRGAAG